MKRTLSIALNVPGNLYRPEFVRRTVEFLRQLARKLRTPNYWVDRTEVGELCRGLLESPRYRYDVKDQSWQRALAALVSIPGSPLMRIAVNVQLPDDVDLRAFERRIEALFDQLEIQMAAAAPDAARITPLAHDLVDVPREFGDTVRSDYGHVPAWGAM